MHLEPATNKQDILLLLLLLPLLLLYPSLNITIRLYPPGTQKTTHWVQPYMVWALSVHTHASLDPLEEKVTAWTPRLPGLRAQKAVEGIAQHLGWHLQGWR